METLEVIAPQVFFGYVLHGGRLYKVIQQRDKVVLCRALLLGELLRLQDVFSCEEEMAYHMDMYDWAVQQLRGVLAPDDSRFWFEVQMVELIYADAMAMQNAEQGVTYFHWPSEFEPRSYSWLI